VLDREVFGGVDTHADVHHAAVVDSLGRRLAHREFPTDPEGYRGLRCWLASHGNVGVVGVEGTGCYGAQLARVLAAAGLVVIEVDRPDRAVRRKNGKSDPEDAYAAAVAVASGRAAGLPKSRDGLVESIRVLRVERRSAIKAKTQAINQIRGILVAGPAQLRKQARGLSRTELIDFCARLRPGSDLTDPAAATKQSLRRLARRWIGLNKELNQLEVDLAPLVAAAAPTLLRLSGVGPDVAGQLLVSAGDNPERLRSEAAFAKLTGTAPLPVSSGRTDRHRLNRGGDRQANKALHTVAINRWQHHRPTQAYVARRTGQGLTNKEILRCLKRSIAGRSITT
jgi:transposase